FYRIKKEEEGNRRNKKEITTKFDEEPIIGLYGLFKKDDSTITGKDIDELIHELEEEKPNLKPHSTES
uniref:hypothetical protein n=1 Tax=Bacteroides xylanisolvens TaxID=371601 RepID=UPI003568A61E